MQQAVLIWIIKAENTSGVVTSSRSLYSNNILYQDRRRPISLRVVPVVALLSLFSFGGVKFDYSNKLLYQRRRPRRSLPVVCLLPFELVRQLVIAHQRITTIAPLTLETEGQLPENAD